MNAAGRSHASVRERQGLLELLQLTPGTRRRSESQGGLLASRCS
jgi:hypothetical protein